MGEDHGECSAQVVLAIHVFELVNEVYTYIGEFSLIHHYLFSKNMVD